MGIVSSWLGLQRCQRGSREAPDPAPTPSPPGRPPLGLHAALPAVRPRHRRWLWGITVGMLVVAAGWFWVVPRVVEAMLLSQLQQRGFEGVEVASTEVGFGHVTVRDLRLYTAAAGGGTLTIATATAGFTWGDLLHQRIDTLVLDGPTWIPAPPPGRSPGPLADGLRRLEAAVAEPRSASPLPQLPLRRVSIHGGRITVPVGDGMTSVTVAGTLAVAERDWRIEAEAGVGTQKLSALLQLHGEQQPAAGTVVLQLLGPTPFALEGPCRLGWEAGGSLLTVELRRRPGAFEVALPDSTWTGDGEVQLQARVPFADLAAAELTLRLAGVRIASTNGFLVQGLDSEVHLQGLPISTSTGAQQARWQQARFAAIEAGSGSAEIELRRGPELRLGFSQRTPDEVGVVSIGELRLLPGMVRFPATIAFDQVPLQQWLEQLSGSRVTGEGRLSGSLTLVVRTQPTLGLDMQTGQLSAVAGGFVRFLDDAATDSMIRQHIEQIAASTGQGAVVQERLVAALKEFVFTVLDFRIEPDAAGDGVTLRVHAVGQGRQVPQPLDLDINLRGFDTAVDTAIAIKLGLDSKQRQVREKLDGQTLGTPMRKESR